MIDLREKDRQAICALARQFFPSGTELWAYGSRVKGTNYAASDLDLVIRGEQPDGVDLELLDEFKTALQNSNIPIYVQVLDWQRIPDSFKSNIEQCYEVLLSI